VLGEFLGGVPQVSVVVSVESGTCLARFLLECNVPSQIMFRNTRIWRPGVPSCLGAFFLANYLQICFEFGTLAPQAAWEHFSKQMLLRNASNLAPRRPGLPGSTFPSKFPSEMLRIWRPGVPGSLGAPFLANSRQKCFEFGTLASQAAWEHFS